MLDPRFSLFQLRSQRRRFGQLSKAALLSIAVSAFGCGDDNTGDTSGGDTGYSPCGDCPAGKEMSDCICNLGFNEVACHNDSSCQSWCAGQGDNMNNRNPWCASSGQSASCVGWDPGSEVSFNSGVYAMDWGFAQQVYADTSQLIVCESSVFEALPTGGFELANVSTRDLAYALGLRNGDIPVSINSMPLDDMYDVATALYDLFVDGGETEYTLVVNRNSSNITLHYELYFTAP